MKALMILGAIVGFAIGAGFGMAMSNPWPSTLWKACAAALVSAVLTRWWSGVWLRGLRESIEHQRTAANAPSAKSNSKA
jgi:hypothetical protein